jgi:hypothetical protein
MQLPALTESNKNRQYFSPACITKRIQPEITLDGDVKMKKYTVVLVLLLASPLDASAGNEYPTMGTVRYVLDCMNELGDVSEENLYSCSCRFDHIRSNMTFEKYEQALSNPHKQPAKADQKQ